jgi:hypothetical protein
MNKTISCAGAALCSLFIVINSVFAQGTAFTYQGQLIAGGGPASGSYDFTFALFNNSSTNTGQVGNTLTNLDVGVTNGLFTVTLDFGAVFTGNATWLAIDVRTNGGVNFTSLSPLQELTPAPYAIYAPNAGSAANVTGAVSLSQLPAAVLTNNGTNAVTLTGTFDGNGVGLTNLNGANLTAGSVGTGQLAGGTLAAPTSEASTNINAAANTSYVATNASPTTIDLPTNANVGDVVQITGEGAGGWTSEELEFIPTLWTQTAVPGENWASVASSSDGTHLVAVVYNPLSPGGIWTSTNSGTNWTQTAAPSEGWWSVASSSDGTHLVAAVYGGGIWISTNSGTNWTQTPAPSEDWRSVASSSDGTHLVAVAGDSLEPGGIYTSINSGANWTQTAAPGKNWESVASSSDGTHLVAANDLGIWTSTNAGTNWTQTAAPNQEWASSVASSSDGTHLVAAASYGGIYIIGGFSYVPFSSGNQGTSATLQYLGNGQWGVVTLAQSSLPGNVVTNTETGVSLSGTFSGNGNGLTDLQATNLTGTISPAQLPSSFSGNGGGLTNLASASLTGTVPAAQLGNAALLAGGNTFAGTQIVNGPVGIDTSTILEGTLTVNTNVYLDANILYLRGDDGVDHNHGLGFFGTGTLQGDFAGINVNGPALFGYSGGVLGTTSGGQHAAVEWSTSSVTVNGTFNNQSDRNAKQDFTSVAPAQILDKVAQLPLSEWSYKTDAATRHIGPMAQDFYAAFAVGTDEKHIAPIDEGGVALAAIQGLNQKLETENAELRQQNDSLAERLHELETTVKTLADRK